MTTSRLREVLDLKPFSRESYDSLDLNRLLVFIISELDRRNVPVTFESIVVAAFRLFPGKFNLVGFPEFPDAARVNRGLLQLRPKYRNWAMGNVKRGFVLTESGQRVLEEVRQALSPGGTHASGRTEQPMVRVDPGRTRDLAKELAVIEGSKLFVGFTDSGTIQPGKERAVYDLLEAYPYTPKRALKGRLRRLETVAEELQHTRVLAFIKELRRAYVPVFADGE